MARYSSNFGNELQLMVATAKEYGLISNFDMLRPFTPRKAELPRKMAIRLPNGLLYPRVEVKQSTHSGDDTVNILESRELNLYLYLPA